MSGLEVLKQYRDEILKAEIGALLFNLGKTHIGFWRQKDGKVYFTIDENTFKSQFGFNIFGSYKNYYEKDNNLGISPFEHELDKTNLKNFIFNEIVKFPFKVKIKDNQESNEIDWVEFFKGDSSKVEFIKKVFFRGCENINSGIDKGAPNKQLEPPLWLSNAFGSFKEEIKENFFDEYRRNFFKNLYRCLKRNNFINGNEVDWKLIRNYILKKVKKWYSHLLSDSRFPINDVTLWDQAYMTASMFKAVISQLILDNNKLEGYQDKPQTIKWRILGIQYNKRGLIEKSLKLPSIRWYRDTIYKIDEEIKKLIEVDYPLGNEIYRDETGIYFIVGEDIENFKDFIEQRLDWLFEDHLQGEIYPYVTFSKPSRGLMNLSTLIEQAKENFLKYSKKSIWLWKLNECKLQKSLCNAVGICPICQVRFITEKDREKRNKPPICEVCDDRIHHKSVEKWLEDLKKGNNSKKETIWMDEIKDKNNKVAYVTLKFELLEWLNGDLINSNLTRLENFHSKLQYIKSLLCSVKKVFINFTNNQNNKNLGEFKNFETSYNSLIKNFLDFFDKKAIQKPYENTVKKIINILKTGVKDQEDKKYLELFSQNFFLFLNKMWRYIREKNKNENQILNSTNNPIVDLEKQTINIKLWGNYYQQQGKANLIKDIFSFSFVYFQIERVVLERSIGSNWETFIYQKLNDWDATQNKPLKQKIDFDKREIYWNKLTDKDIEFLATLILQFLLRKNPSPARLRRIWESTKEFFEEIHQNLDEILEIPEWRKTRIAWTLNEEFKNIKPTGEELEDEKGLLYWVQPNERKVYLISNIRDFLLQYGDGEIKKLLRDLDNATTSKEVSEINEKLNQLLENIKDHLEVIEISLHKIGENQNVLKFRIKENIESQEYNPYALITDTTPTNYQVIIPAEYLPNFIDKVLEKYDEYFKYVYGKLPLHIGIVVSRYDRPVYVNLQALRRIRRDVENADKLWIKREKEKFEKILKEKFLNLIKRRDKTIYENLKNKSLIEILEKIKEYPSLEDLRDEALNDTYKYYSLYFHNTDKKDYNFYIKPDETWHYWISTIDKFPQNGKVKIIPNTFDFEYLDHNIRRNEIFYTDDGKRIPYLRSNRPYELETHWWKFKKFRELVKDTNLPSNRLHKLVEVLYSHLLDAQGLEDPNWERRSYTLFAEFANWLELQKEEKRRELIKEIFDLNTAEWKAFKEQLREALTKEENIKLFVDMFDFWHNLMEEV